MSQNKSKLSKVFNNEYNIAGWRTKSEANDLSIDEFLNEK